MPSTLLSYINNGYNYSSYAYSALINAANDFVELGTQLEAENFTQAQTICNTICNELLTVASRALGDSGSNCLRGRWYQALTWINTNWPTGGSTEITMDDILNAMLPASFDQLTKFIGIVDAYRLALWNAPFNAEFYASLARGYQKWP